MSRTKRPRTGLEIRAAARARDLRRTLAEDLRRGHEDAGLSQRRVAAIAGLSVSTVHAVENVTFDPGTEVLTRLASALGMDLSMRLYPGTGPPIRDRSQAAMLNALIAIVDPRWRATPEVPVSQPVRGVIDLVLDDTYGKEVVACEAQSELRRLEQQVRWSRLKAEALRASRAGHGHGPDVGRLLLLRSTRRTRAIVAEHAELMSAAYPAGAAEIHAELTGDASWPGDGILWCRLEQGIASVLAQPPRGIGVGR